MFQVQDESSILVGHILDPEPGEVILDMCSAPGGKTIHLAQLTKNQGKIIAVDNNAARLSLVKEACKRLGAETVSFIKGDATKPEQLSQKQFDRVLVDAPC